MKIIEFSKFLSFSAKGHRSIEVPSDDFEVLLNFIIISLISVKMIAFYQILIFICIISHVSSLITQKSIQSRSKFTTKLHQFDETLVSVVAGAISGSVGVGLAFPIDTIKIKSQVYASNSKDGKSLGAIKTMNMVLKEEGISGFYGGVIWVMIGQAFIKSSAFASNTFALNTITDDPVHATLFQLMFAAFFAGFMSSFFVNPIERVKILMQADSSAYKNDLDCFLKVLQKDGGSGLVLRGFVVTFAYVIQLT
jgi:hypothetical protein